MVRLSARSFSVLACLLFLGSVMVPGGLAQGASHTATSVEVTSFDGTAITINVCQPTGTGPGNTVPVILHSHGWGGSKSGCGSFEDYYAAGFGVVSISQRGFGGSGGQANVHDPDFEGWDNLAVIDYVAMLDWVTLDAPGDPLMGAIGGSYGGGYQYLIAFMETALHGDTRLDAMVPEITWHNLINALAPNQVVRSEWVAALYGVGAASLPQYVHEAAVFTFATGMYPGPGTPFNLADEFLSHGPAYWVEQGHRIDVPTLLGQGLTDTLFVINEGRDNFERTMTPEARAQSYFIGYNGGHVLPTVYPLGVGVGGDPCSSELGTDFAGLGIRFLRNHLLGASETLPSSTYSMATTDGQSCIHVEDLDTTVTIRPDPINVAKSPVDGVAVAPGMALATYWPVLENLGDDMTLTGIPELHARVTSTPLTRTFLGLAVGSTPGDAQVIDSQWMPYSTDLPTLDEVFQTELGGISTIVPVGQNLYLVAAPVVDQFFAHGGRVPAVAVFDDIQVSLPVVGDVPTSETSFDLGVLQPTVEGLYSLPRELTGSLSVPDLITDNALLGGLRLF